MPTLYLDAAAYAKPPASEQDDDRAAQNLKRVGMLAKQ